MGNNGSRNFDEKDEIIISLLSLYVDALEERDGLAAKVDRLERANDKNIVDRNHWYLKYVEHSDLSNELQEQFDEERELHGDTLNEYDDLLEEFEELKEAYEEQGSTADHYRNLYYDLHGEYQAAVSDLIALEEGYDHVSEVGAGYQDQLIATKEQLAACEEALTDSMSTTEFVVNTAIEAIEYMEQKQGELNAQLDEANEELARYIDGHANMAREMRRGHGRRCCQEPSLADMMEGYCATDKDEDDDYHEYLFSILKGL